MRDALAGRIADALDERNAIAYVHVGRASDPGLRYCTGLPELDCQHAFVYRRPAAAENRSPHDAVLLVLDRRLDAVRSRFDGTVWAIETTPGQAAADVLETHPDSGTVLTPRTIPHDAALYLEDAGYDLASSDVVNRARRSKSDDERDRLSAVQSAGRDALDRVTAQLRQADCDGERLSIDGEHLTVGRLRTTVDVALAEAGCYAPPGSTVSIVPETIDGGVDEDTPIEPTDAVTVSLFPRCSAGYHGRIARTFVADLEGGWERRAHVAVEGGRSAAFGTATAGTPVETVETEAAAEVAAYGFDPEAATASVYGVGLSRRERPLPGSELRVGDVIAIDVGVTDPDYGSIRLADLALVGEEHTKPFVDYPTSLVP